ncbi:MAG: DNA-directed RNA polymerase subunit beta', partial [Syntrophorhabdus sp.]
DFDGDQMAVHVPLSTEAQTEARVLMMSTNNILSPANGKPIIVPTQDIVLGLYYLTIDRKYRKGENKIFADSEEVRVAYDSGMIDLHARVIVRLNGEMVNTTPGRIILRDVVQDALMELEQPKRDIVLKDMFASINTIMDKKTIAALVDKCYRDAGEKCTVILSDRLKDLGYFYATLGGISISIDDMKIPAKKKVLIEKAEDSVKTVQNQYQEGLITDGERYNQVIDIWANVTEEIAKALMDELGSDVVIDMNGKPVVQPNGKFEHQNSLNPIFMMAHSGARGNAQQIRQLAGMRGLMAKPSGEIIETPITSNFREGLDVLQYFISTHGARKGLADTALKTANSGYLTRRLVDVAQDVVVSETDCGTFDYIEIGSLVEGGEVIERLDARILGRVSFEDMRDPDGAIIVHKNEEITEHHLKLIEEGGFEKVKIRSVLTCRSRRGVCVLCYGRDLARGRLVSIGEAVGIIAAQSIGEPGTQLTMRTFHIGGAASRRVEQSTLETRNEGIVKFINVRAILNREGVPIVMNRNGEIAIMDDTGRERELYSVIYGAKLRVQDGQAVQEGETLAEWDPYTIPILSEESGRIKYGDIFEGETMQESKDEVTGLSYRVIIEPKNPELRPRISIKDEKSRTKTIPGSTSPARYILPIGAHIVVNEGDEIYAGDVISKMPRETTKTKDITGGLPRVAELFEARKPKENAIVTEINGIVTFGKMAKGKREIIVTPDTVHGEPRKYTIPRGKHVIVHEGDYVRAGEPLMDGPVNPHDVLRILGIKDLARYLVDEIQEVYQLQGVKINDKHIETIVRQMLKRVKIKDIGDTNFIIDDYVE